MAPKIMIVEDNPDIRQALEKQLRTANYQTVWSEDARHAVTLCRLERPSLILLDLGLVGGDGFMVMETLRKVDETPIVVLSARDRDLNEALAIELGAVAFMEKPASLKELLATVKKYARIDQDVLCEAG